MEKLFDAEGVAVYIRNLPGKVALRVGGHNTLGHGIRREASMTPSEARILAYKLLELAERHS